MNIEKEGKREIIKTSCCDKILEKKKIEGCNVNNNCVKKLQDIVIAVRRRMGKVIEITEQGICKEAMTEDKEL